MQKEEFQNKFNSAKDLRDQAEVDAALNNFNDLYDQLIMAAGDYAKTIPGTVVDFNGQKRVTPLLFSEADKYLKRNDFVHQVLIQLSELYTIKGDKKKSEDFLAQAMKHKQED